MKKRVYSLVLLIIIGIVITLVKERSLFFSIISLLAGFILVLAASEVAVEGFKGFSEYTGLSEYVTGIVSSLASNLPEAVLALFMVFSPHLKEVAILTVMLASAFNGLLLGILVIMLTYKGESIEIPREALERDVEIMRITIAFSTIILGTGLILNIFHGSPYLPVEVPVFLLVAYLSYLYFISRRSKERVKNKQVRSTKWVSFLVLGLLGILISAELISGASEFLVHELELHVVIAATLIAFAGSIPEHGLALIGARKGHVELGVSNLISGIVQSIMLVFPILAIIIPVYLDGYVLYQFLAIALTLWIVKKAIIDDGKLTLDEGVSILMTHLLGIILFDELSWLI
ncbi:MAG: hypothetical protein DRJ38_05740 [Thermoprotei archaeon]|nr:MAG: hypothetical protein DRJ38_05740 [Thermoprotei archaeon]